MHFKLLNFSQGKRRGRLLLLLAPAVHLPCSFRHNLTSVADVLQTLLELKGGKNSIKEMALDQM